MRKKQLTVIVGVAALLGAAGCGPRPSVETGPGADECRVATASGSRADTVTVALADPVDFRHAPEGTNPSERLVFAQLYETLVSIDCRGAPAAGLASAWSRHDGGRRWTLTLRDDATFTDRSPLIAQDVVRGWRGAITRGAGVDSVVALDTRRLDVFVENPACGLEPLASPALAVTRPDVDTDPPVGTGPCRVATRTASDIVVRPLRGRGPVIHFVQMSATGGDPRDALDAGVDAMVTARPDVADYARSRGFAVEALAYDRVYVLVSTHRVEAMIAGAVPDTLSASVTEHIARNAVRDSDARGPERPTWWTIARGCGDVSPFAAWQVPSPRNTATGAQPPRVLYAAGDPVAHDLAERVVALAAMDDRATPDAAAVKAALPSLAARASVAVAVGDDELEASLRAGDDAAYIVALPCHPADGCQAARRLLMRVPWLAARNVGLTGALIPLAETRAFLISATGRFTATTDYYGDVRFSGARDGRDAP